MKVSTEIAPIKGQGTRLIKVVCPDASCGVILRMTRKYLINRIPTCACGKKMEAHMEPRMRPAGRLRRRAGA